MTYISLAGNCSVAFHLNKLGVNKIRYPFDWCSVNINQLLQVLSNDFNSYSKLTFKKKSENHPSNKSSSSLILTNKYGIKFAHEIIEKYQINLFEKKLDNRIKRFNSLINPTFVRLEYQNKSDKYFLQKYLQLIELLNNKFGDYKLILIIKNKIKINSPKIEIKNFNNFSSDWKYPNVDWKNIFLNN